MDSYTLVRTEHLNHYGKLFGGQLLKWVDEYAWMSASLEFPGKNLVTRAMEKCEFKHSVANGSILRFSIILKTMGFSSVTYSVDVFADEPGGTKEKLIFSNHVTFVSVGAEGQKVALTIENK